MYKDFGFFILSLFSVFYTSGRFKGFKVRYLIISFQKLFKRSIKIPYFLSYSKKELNKVLKEQRRFKKLLKDIKKDVKFNKKKKKVRKVK